MRSTHYFRDESGSTDSRRSSVYGDRSSVDSLEWIAQELDVDERELREEARNLRRLRREPSEWDFSPTFTPSDEEDGEDSAPSSFEENFNPDEPHSNFGHFYTEGSSSAAVSETGTDPIETSESDGTGSGNAGDVSSSDSESVGNQHSDSDDNYWEYYTAEEYD